MKNLRDAAPLDAAEQSEFNLERSRIWNAITGIAYLYIEQRRLSYDAMRIMPP
jgi:hypothetical protein